MAQLWEVHPAAHRIRPESWPESLFNTDPKIWCVGHPAGRDLESSFFDTNGQEAAMVDSFVRLERGERGGLHFNVELLLEGSKESRRFQVSQLPHVVRTLGWT